MLKGVIFVTKYGEGEVWIAKDADNFVDSRGAGGLFETAEGYSQGCD